MNTKTPDGPPEKSNTPRMTWRLPVYQLALMLALVWFWHGVANRTDRHTISYSEFKTHLVRGEVKEVAISETELTGKIVMSVVTNNASAAANNTSKTVPNATAPEAPSASSAVTPATAWRKLFAPRSVTNTPPSGTFAFRTVRVEDPKLAEELQAAGVNFTGSRPSALSQFLMAWIIPLAVMAALWLFLSRKLAGGPGGALLNIGKSRAKLIADKDTGVNFEDVAGCDEAKFELQEVVDFLKNPTRYKSLGAKIPRGALLIGPPGTGKTLLARAVAGEAGVPFFSLSGSDFVEMFVGVGASRVRDLFQQAKAQAPCIIFIDELDAIGRQRGLHVGAVNDEREQTLNQLLVEMDGFEGNGDVIILAATNRPEVLDRALLRPGRFDRQVLVDSPDATGRHAILKVHARNKPLAPDADLERIARATPGFSGADLANTLNEAALLAARRHAETIAQHDLENAIEKVVAGPERKGRRLNAEQRSRVAFHEVGHALIAAHSKGADPVHKISIVPRGRAALGYTMQLPTEDQFLLTSSELKARIRGLLGGRAAEEIVFGELTTGAQNDLERATALARQMVCMFGMSGKLGLAHVVQRPPSFLGVTEHGTQRDCSEATAREIDEEVKAILDRCYSEAKEILELHRDQLEGVTAALLKSETLNAAEFYALIKRSESKHNAAPEPTRELRVEVGAELSLT